MLVEENENLKKRLRASEAILASGTQERRKFMEGASWVAKKSQIECDRTCSKVVMLVNEFENRTKNSCIDLMLREYNGGKVEENKDWIRSELLSEMGDLGTRFETIFQNINYQLHNAVQSFKVGN